MTSPIVSHKQYFHLIDRACDMQTCVNGSHHFQNLFTSSHYCSQEVCRKAARCHTGRKKQSSDTEQSGGYRSIQTA